MTFLRTADSGSKTGAFKVVFHPSSRSVEARVNPGSIGTGRQDKACRKADDLVKKREQLLGLLF